MVNNISSNHTFERFLIQKINQNIQFYIIGFTFDETLEGTGFPYTTEHLPLDSNNINLAEFIETMTSSQFYWVGDCLWEIREADYGEPGSGYLIFIGCDEGTGGGPKILFLLMV